MLFGDRECVSTFHEYCSDSRNIDLLRVFDRANPATYGEFGLAEAQRNALEAGYFEVPMEAQLDDIAAALDISPQATSQRLRRGHTALLRNTLETHG